MSEKILASSSFNQINWIKKLHECAISAHYRAAVVCSGDRVWGKEIAQSFIETIACHSVLSVSLEIPHALSAKKARTQLGNEYDAIVFDAYDDFDVDAFGVISGTLRGGGLLFVLLPDVENWYALKNSRFLQRILPIMQQHKNIFYLQQNKPFPDIPDCPANQQIKKKVDAPYKTLDQQQVVNAIKNNILNKQNNPVVLISDRGRGKSSALGLVAGQLLQQGVKNIIVTAPGLTTSEPVFRHAYQVLPEAKLNRSELLWKDSLLKFIAPDALLKEKPQADLLLVDEAASIPLPMLEGFLKFYPAITFATTIHGYEGTGRGFALKFNKVLDQTTPNWQCFKMEEPIRWAADDPVECWVDKLLCMDADLPEVSDINEINISNCIVNEVNRDELINDNKKLTSIFSLLVFAHYRTKPSDLKHLLDDSGVRLYVLEYQHKILAAILINEEGGFDKKLSSDIYCGKRRPAGHLLPQTLTFHAGCEHAATLSYARIMRIAVHPQLQNKGLGSYFLNKVVKSEAQKNVVAIGTSFGSNIDLIRFWQRADFKSVRLGFTRDHVSGAHSVVMMKPFNKQGEEVFKDVRDKFNCYLPVWIKEPLADMPENILQLLAKEAVIDSKELSDSDWKEIKSFVYTHRGYETCMWPVKKLIRQAPELFECLNKIEKQIVTEKVKNNSSWSDVIKQLNLKGRAEAVSLLREAVSKMIKDMILE